MRKLPPVNNIRIIDCGDTELRASWKHQMSILIDRIINQLYKPVDSDQSWCTLYNSDEYKTDHEPLDRFVRFRLCGEWP